MSMRIGHGYDVHRLTKKRPLILGGVNVPFEYGLLGHSDADVLTHAIMDAILGAAGLGDIGIHFPDTDNSYKNVSSLVLLSNVKEIISDKWNVINIDATVVSEAPKLGALKKQMAKNISDTLGICESQVNIKATTEEGLGFANKGIAAHAVCMVGEK